MGPSAKIESIITYRNAKILAGFLVLFHLLQSFLFKDNLSLQAEFSDLIIPMACSFGAGGLIYALLKANNQSKKVRFALILMASGMIFNTLAEIVWSILEIGLHQQPFPSLADGFYIMFYPLFATGIMFLPTDKLAIQERYKFIIDITIIMMAAVLIFWDFLIGPILAAGDESALALGLSTAYPILDLVLLFALIELLYRQQSSLNMGPMMLLVVAVTMFIVSDTNFIIQNSSETYASGGLLDTGFILSYSLIGLAGILQASEWKFHPEDVPKITRYDHSTWIRYLPYIGAGAAYLLLIWNLDHPLPIDLSETTLFIGGIIGLVILRQIMALNENTSLYLKTKEEINERKATEEALKDSKNRLNDIIEFLPDATLVIDNDGKVISWNRAIETMTGVNAKDILGKGNYEYAIPFYGQRRPILIDLVLKSQEEIERNYLNIVRKDGILVGEAYMPNLNGGRVYLVGTAATLYDSKSNVVGSIESIRDITGHKLAEESLYEAHNELEHRVKDRTAELEARNAEMERFIYTVSHELRSPLISTGGLVGFLKRDLEMGDANRTETDMRLIEGAVTKMDQLLTEILELSRIGRVANPPVDVPFGEIVTEALDQEAEKLKSREVEVLVASDLPKVHVDRMRIMEVLVNLIENSIKYMGDQPRPRIEVGHRLDGDQTVFIVRDNGMGIDPSQHEKVFGLFYKVNGKSEGTGVGLAIVKRIIEVHGGRIWIESELGQGCTVYFTLPIADVG